MRALRRHLGHLGHVPGIVRRGLGRLDLRGIGSIRGSVALGDIAAIHAAGFGAGPGAPLPEAGRRTA